MQIRIIPRYFYKQAKQLDWIGSNADKYQLHEFQDTTGQALHGTSIIVKEEVDISMLSTLKSLQKQRRVALKILAAFRWKKKNSLTLRSKSKAFGRENIFKRNPCNEKKKQISCRALQLASESYKHVVENCDLGNIIIVEQCYLILGTDHKKHSLLIASLQQLIDSVTDFKTLPNLHEHLEKIQTSIHLSPNQECISYPKSELEHICQKRKVFEVTVNSSLPPIKYTLPLPHMSTEWGLAQLMLKFKLSEVINVLMLLLIERPVLIIGHSHEEVSACTLALKALLRPYSWPNVIIPSLPEDIMDIVSSPVA